MNVCVLLGSAVLVAVIVSENVAVPTAPLGAVYTPRAEIVPSVADHVTSFELDPVTVALNVFVPL
jgi:hypothetical protein